MNSDNIMKGGVGGSEIDDEIIGVNCGKIIDSDGEIIDGMW